jgi:hypothetical protein
MKKLIGFSIFSLLLFVLIIFQNCSVSKPESARTDAGTEDSRTANNSQGGGVYDGKLYTSILPEICADGSPAHVDIEVNDESAVLTHDGCADTQTSVNYSSLQLKPHNLSQLVYGARALSESSGPAAHLFCRGSENKVFADRTELDVVDLILRKEVTPTGEKQFLVDVKLGVYDETGTKLLETYQVNNFKVEHRIRNGEPTYYGMTPDSMVVLIIHSENPDGTYVANASYKFNLANVTRDQGIQNTSPGDLTSEETVGRILEVKCYPGD